VVWLGVTDDWLDRVTPFVPAALLLAQWLVFASDYDPNGFEFGVHAAGPQIGQSGDGFGADVFNPGIGLPEQLSQHAHTHLVCGELCAPTSRPLLTWLSARQNVLPPSDAAQ